VVFLEHVDPWLPKIAYTGVTDESPPIAEAEDEMGECTDGLAA
jgi:hypothetical protein